MNEPKPGGASVPLDCVVSMPVRVQLRRTKGWKMPPNTVKVDRTTKWGNPFVVGSDKNPLQLPVQDKRHAFALYRSIAVHNEKLIAAAQYELRGKNLACWCAQKDPYEDACHAAVLLDIANRPHEAANTSFSRSEPDGERSAGSES